MPKNLHKHVSCRHMNCIAKRGKPAIHILSNHRSRYPGCEWGPCECPVECCKENLSKSKVKRQPKTGHEMFTCSNCGKERRKKDIQQI